MLAATYFFWFPSNFPSGVAQPIDRAEWMWLLGLLIPVMIARWQVYGRLWSQTPMDIWLALLLVIGVWNVSAAPYPSRGVRMLARALLGMALVIYMTEVARREGSMETPLRIMVILGGILGVAALGMSQWNEKAVEMQTMIDNLPRITMFTAPGGFNANEIAGALAWLTPLAAGVVFYPWRKVEGARFSSWSIIAAIVFAMLLLAMILGQSRFALAGVLSMLAVVGWLIVPKGWLRWSALGILALIITFQVNLVLNIVPLTTTESTEESSIGIAARDERTLNRRFEMWGTVLDILRDHPLTGVGMDRFRYGEVRQDYPVSTYETRILPHAHNEFMQIAADLGIPGLIVFIAWHGVMAYMVVVCWFKGDNAARVVTVSAAAGILAHMAYGMGDAVTLWARFTYIFWLMMGVIVAQYVLVRESAREQIDDSTDASDDSRPHRQTQRNRAEQGTHT